MEVVSNHGVGGKANGVEKKEHSVHHLMAFIAQHTSATSCRSVLASHQQDVAETDNTGLYWEAGSGQHRSG